MHSHRARTLLAGLSLIMLVRAIPAPAQTAQRWSSQGSGLYAGLSGKAYNGLDDGYGGEFQVRYTPSRLSFGAGMQITAHHLTGGGSNNNARLWGGFVEPRLRIRTSSPVFAPYLSARFAYLRLSLASGSVSGSTGGATINGGGGILLRLGPRVNLDLGSTWGYTSFQKLSIRNRTSGQVITSPLGSGSNIVVRAGLTLGLFN